MSFKIEIHKIFFFFRESKVIKFTFQPVRTQTQIAGLSDELVMLFSKGSNRVERGLVDCLPQTCENRKHQIVTHFHQNTNTDYDFELIIWSARLVNGLPNPAYLNLRYALQSRTCAYMT